MIDTHCHLAGPAFPDPRAVLDRARSLGVLGVVAVGSDPASNLAVLALAARHPGEVWAALGLHPERLDLGEAAFEAVETQILGFRQDLIAVGEVGLPWYRLEGRADARDLMRAAKARLRRLLELARRLDLAVSLHAPHGAAEEALELLEAVGVERAVFHWHKGPPEVTRRIVGRGYFVSLTPEAAYRERDRELAREVPLEQLVAESDGPWAFGGEFEGRAGEPGMVARVAEAVAEVKGLPVPEVAEQLLVNSRRCFGVTP